MRLRRLVRAFTLIELLIVVSIISILAVIALPNFEDAQTRSKVAAVKSNMRVVATKLEMLNIDSNHYPLAAKWRWGMLWYVLPEDHQEGLMPAPAFQKRTKTLYGPHWDLFEWTALKQYGAQDDTWVPVRDDRMFLFHGFTFFQPSLMLKALDYGVTWEDSDVRHWQGAEEAAGEWMLLSPGPDLVQETPSWLQIPGGGSWDLPEEGYKEQNILCPYDPTNGTVSYGNIFRSHKNPGGFMVDPKYFENGGNSRSPG